MVPTTVEGLLVLLVTVLPGALFAYGYERRAASYSVTAGDRVLRFVALSLAFDLLYAPPVFLVWESLTGDGLTSSRFALLWTVAAVGLGLPVTFGLVVGGRRRTWSARARPVRAVVARRPPRAWDHVFDAHTPTFVRVALSDGTRIGGRFGDRSYAAQFPHDGDLFLDEVWPVSADGTFGDAPLGYGRYPPPRRSSPSTSSTRPTERSPPMRRKRDWIGRIIAWLDYEEYVPDDAPLRSPPPPPPPRTPSGASTDAGLNARYIPPSDEAWRLWRERYRAWEEEEAQRRSAQDLAG